MSKGEFGITFVAVDAWEPAKDRYESRRNGFLGG